MIYPPTATEARISEIFSSLQGEGTHVGERHIFIRFEECHIHCEYCDELDKKGQNLSLDKVIDQIQQLENEFGPHTFVSLTGGEPLLYLTFIKPLAKWLREHDYKVYLETNGILWKALAEIIDDCDCIAMDVKPASVTKEKEFEDDHRQFLEMARTKETFIKMVLSREIDIPEFDRLVQIIDEIAPEIPLILQPISTDIEGHEDSILMKLLAELQARAAKKLQSVRIVPRMHRILKIR